MQNSVAKQLSRLVDEGGGLQQNWQIERWSAEAFAFLQTAIGLGAAQAFDELRTEDPYFQHALRMGHLQGLLAKAEADSAGPDALPAPASPPIPAQVVESRKVFVVHGHDNEAKEGTARFLQVLGLVPIVLHEQPNSGRTIMEKFETYSGDIAFAVVLLTPDDLGGITGTVAQRPRARQNVIMELGYFMGRLGRSRVCALHKGGVELPSDYQGVLYIELDSAGAWKLKLAQELSHAKLPIDLGGLLSG